MKKKRNKLYVLIIIVVSSNFLIGCKKGVPGNVIQPAKMELLLYDYHISKAMSDELPQNERYKQTLYLEYVFDKYNTTQEVFDSSMVWYTRHTKELNRLYENVNKRFKEEQKGLDDLIALQEDKPRTSIAGDTVNVWYKNQVYKLSHYLLNNKLSFIIPADSNYKAYDSLAWIVNYTFLPVNRDSLARDSAIMSLSLFFENDSIISNSKKVVASGVDSLSLYTDSLYMIKEIRGFIYYQGKTAGKELLLNDIYLMRYHRALNDSINLSDSIPDVIEEIKIDERESLADTIVSSDTIINVPKRRSPQEIREESRRK